MRTRNRWGWGYEDAVISAEEAVAAAAHLPATLGFAAQPPEAPATSFALPAPKAAVPAELAAFGDASDEARALHAYGKSYLDTIRAFRGRYDHAPCFVARARNEADVEAVLEWAAGAGAAVIPYGGGTSVVGGVEARVDGPAVCLDVGALDRVLEVDEVSRAARIQAGAAGPHLEQQLGERGMTLRFFPQSFELSTLGGWIATRAGGHFATRLTHMDDLVESVRAITPSGAWQSRRLPGSGAGPSPDRMLVGSEGILGVITEAWVRVQPKPEHRASRAVTFPAFERGADAVRALAQSGLHPSNCRLIDELEARQTASADSPLLVLGFESTDTPVDHLLERGLEICREHGGEPRASSSSVGDWREAFIRMPYLRDMLVRLGILADTFETAITWDRFPAFHAAVLGATRAALGEPCRVTCRFTHVYPDGPAPYFTVLAPARRGDEEAQWWEMKRAASDAIIAAGGTITHHHAVGRDHRPWYDAQRPELFAAALRGAKAAVDPGAIMNPGVLIPHESA
ncbi:MAG: alkyldihydroxyacetonephosphate synthase [Solirubrobacteraceae bacterium]|nr:alkyldihydroxyacetonephosphate synthase [Solirubrobacteraceae bacterium]